jgi:hypothetical protein
MKIFWIEVTDEEGKIHASYEKAALAKARLIVNGARHHPTLYGRRRGPGGRQDLMSGSTYMYPFVIPEE